MSGARGVPLRLLRAAAAALAAVPAIALLAIGLVVLGAVLVVAGLAAVGAAAVVALLAAAALARAAGRRVPRRTILEVDLIQPPAGEGGSGLGRLRGRRRLSLRQLVELLERAAGDRRVVGLIAHLGTPASGLADAQELRDAVLRFRAAGKFALAHADTFGELSAGNAAYYLATGFCEIVLQPSGDVALIGIAAEMDFLRGALERAGVDVDAERRWEYKTALERLTEHRLSPAGREAIDRLVESQFDQLVTAVAEGRRLSAERVRALIDAAPIVGPEAKRAGLVDALGYRDEAAARAREHASGGRPLQLAAYGRRRRRRRGGVVAMIECSGAIVRGHSRPHPLTRSGAGAETLAGMIRRAAATRRVRAILLRIESPGGSYVGSDTIWREIVRAREGGTPVVASMGNVAASGGYFVASAADRVVAHGMTVTGSIGVIGAKPVVRGLKQKLGIGTEAVRRGANALIASSSQAWDQRQRAAVQAWLDRAYADFTGKVASGRGLTPERIDELARGRVWSGADAAERGLVDALGGYPAALSELRRLLGVAPDAPLQVRPFPRRRPLRQRLRGESDFDGASYDAGIQGDAVAALAPLAGTLAWAAREGPLALALLPPAHPLEPWSQAGRVRPELSGYGQGSGDGRSRLT